MYIITYNKSTVHACFFAKLTISCCLLFTLANSSVTILSGPLDSGSWEVRIMHDRVCSNQVTCMLTVSASLDKVASSWRLLECFKRMLLIQPGSSQHTQGPSCDSQPQVDQRVSGKYRDWCATQVDRPIKHFIQLESTIVIAICVIKDKVVYMWKAVLPHTWSRGISKQYGPMTLLYSFAFLRSPFPLVMKFL